MIIQKQKPWLIRTYAGHSSAEASNNLYKKNFKANDAFIFGNETKGLPDIILEQFSNKNKLRIPMLKESRSLNLSNAVSIILYEAWRQNNFLNAKISYEED